MVGNMTDRLYDRRAMPVPHPPDMHASTMSQ
jgi:hypothetical protein